MDLASIPVAAFQPTAVAAIDGVVQAARAAASAMVGAVKAPATMGLKDQMTLKVRGPIPLYYESLYMVYELKPF